MAEINFFRGPTSQVDNVPVADGQIVFDTDKRTISMDYHSSRLVMGSTFKYHYPTITRDMWDNNLAFVECQNADEYNIMLGVPNPTNIENIEAVRDAALSISEISATGIYITCVNLPKDAVQLALQLSERIEEEL